MFTIPRKTFRKIITSDELIEKINPINKMLMKKFLKYKNAKCSDTTIIGYESDLNIYFCYNVIENENKSFIDTKKLEMAAFFDYGLMELKWSGNRYQRMRSLMNSFSDFIVDFMDEDFPNFKNIVNKSVEKVEKVPVRKKTVILPDQVYLLRDTLMKENKLQEATYLMLLASSGARISESLRIDINMIDENNTAFEDLFLETTDELKTKGHGKNGTMMTRFIIKDVFLPIYKQWIPMRTEIMQKNGKIHNKMFVKDNGNPITKAVVRTWIKNWEAVLGVNLYAHCFRHFIVSDLTRKGCSSDFIVAVMKWKSADMYRIYNDIEDKDKKWVDIGKLKGALNVQ